MVGLIYDKCGTPTEATWPGVTSLRFYKDLSPDKPTPNQSKLRHFLKDNKM
jgi:hypothetical protein